MCFRLFLYIYGNKLQTLVDDSYTVVIFSPFVTSRDDLFLSIVAIRFTVNDFFGVRGQVTERNVAGRETLVIQQREYSRKFVGRCACSALFHYGCKNRKEHQFDRMSGTCETARRRNEPRYTRRLEFDRSAILGVFTHAIRTKSYLRTTYDTRHDPPVATQQTFSLFVRFS